jgi:hypothetical protein
MPRRKVAVPLTAELEMKVFQNRVTHARALVRDLQNDPRTKRLKTLRDGLHAAQLGLHAAELTLKLCAELEAGVVEDAAPPKRRAR